ncbi:hypothetical protein FNW02_06095 [Komarekiella sp. 'clone 1']|uniref:Uncharacterized protein n=1 Tax=Komarekiella delphini-convector SJRDD-AB1 TaxID=2593771 RepID=A0AA40SUC5_9NOST|nr:hypothetical protein [Komarekiella delphini-convector]MBD6615426.1 hypothetical protein [Komarekiella delphini-convector SJRDD-AB1]
MQSNPDNSNMFSDLTSQPENALSESFTSKIQQPHSPDIPKLVFFPSLSRIFSGSPGKLIIAGLLLVGILATFFIFSQGSDVCLLSYCLDNPIPAASLGDDFLAFSGGTAALVLLTTLLGTPLLPAVGISAGIWFLLHISLH